MDVAVENLEDSLYSYSQPFLGNLLFWFGLYFAWMLKIPYPWSHLYPWLLSNLVLSLYFNFFLEQYVLENCIYFLPIIFLFFTRTILFFSSVQFSSVAQLCPTLCDPMNRSTPGLPVHHQLLEFTQTHVYRVSDAIQPSHPLSSPSPAPNPSQHQSLFQWVNSSHEVAKVLEFQL